MLFFEFERIIIPITRQIVRHEKIRCLISKLKIPKLSIISNPPIATKTIPIHECLFKLVIVVSVNFLFLRRRIVQNLLQLAFCLNRKPYSDLSFFYLRTRRILRVHRSQLSSRKEQLRLSRRK